MVTPEIGRRRVMPRGTGLVLLLLGRLVGMLQVKDSLGYIVRTSLKTSLRVWEDADNVAQW